MPHLRLRRGIRPEARGDGGELGLDVLDPTLARAGPSRCSGAVERRATRHQIDGPEHVGVGGKEVEVSGSTPTGVRLTSIRSDEPIALGSPPKRCSKNGGSTPPRATLAALFPSARKPRPRTGSRPRSSKRPGVDSTDLIRPARSAGQIGRSGGPASTAVRCVPASSSLDSRPGQPRHPRYRCGCWPRERPAPAVTASGSC